MKIKLITSLTCLLLVFPTKGFGQIFGTFSNEIGILTGPVAFYGDYGQRNNIATNIGNTGCGFALAHYINFAYRADCKCYNRDTYFNDRFKVRTEITFHKTNFEHYGQWVQSSAILSWP